MRAHRCLLSSQQSSNLIPCLPHRGSAASSLGVGFGASQCSSTPALSTLTFAGGDTRTPVRRAAVRTPPLHAQSASSSVATAGRILPAHAATTNDSRTRSNGVSHPEEYVASGKARRTNQQVQSLQYSAPVQQSSAAQTPSAGVSTRPGTSISTQQARPSSASPKQLPAWAEQYLADQATTTRSNGAASSPTPPQSPSPPSRTSSFSATPPPPQPVVSPARRPAAPAAPSSTVSRGVGGTTAAPSQRPAVTAASKRKLAPAFEPVSTAAQPSSSTASGGPKAVGGRTAPSKASVSSTVAGVQTKVDPITGRTITVVTDAAGKRTVMTEAALVQAQTTAVAAAAQRPGPGAQPLAAKAAKAAEGTSRRSMPRLVMHDGEWVMLEFEEDLAGVREMSPVYQARLRAAINAEKMCETEALSRLYASSSLKRLQKEGLVLTSLVAERQGEMYRSTVWRMHFNNHDETLPYHRFRNGDSILLTPMSAKPFSRPSPAATRSASSTLPRNLASEVLQRAGGPSAGGPSAGAPSAVPGADETDLLEAVVLEVRKGHVLVAAEGAHADALDAQAKQHPGMQWRMDQSITDTTTSRQLAALDSLYGQPGGGMGMPQVLWKDPSAISEKMLRCVLMGSRNAATIANQPPLWVTEAAWRERARMALQTMDGLNDSQRSAVASAITRSLTLWQGPPGTGKTRTLLSLMDVLVKTSSASASSWSAMQAVLACADTNAAVDNLVDGLQQRGIRVVRVGQPAKVREDLRPLTLDALAEATEDGQRGVELRHMAQDALDTFQRSLPRGVPLKESQRKTLERLTDQAKQATREADGLQRKAVALVLARAQVVCSTCTGAGDRAIADRMFRMVVIDEASQATEPATLIPLMRGAQCVVMAGDPQQLPPTIMSQEAYRYDLDVTMFERIASKGVTPLLLDRQYRMHPAISAFPAAHFYGGRLMDAVKADERAMPLGFAWPAPGCPVAIVAVEDGREQRADTAGKKGDSRAPGGKGAATAAGADTLRDGDGSSSSSSSGGGSSYRNIEEAAVVMRIVTALLEAGDVATCALLTPYRGQVRCLEALLRSPAVAAQLGSLADGITVSSVDGFQGREADVVVFTTVRCNPNGQIGFVSDYRRLNVAITRPRRGLVVVGSPRTLARGSTHWREYLKWAKRQGCIMDVRRLKLGERRLDDEQLHAGAASLSEEDDEES